MGLAAKTAGLGVSGRFSGVFASFALSSASSELISIGFELFSPSSELISIGFELSSPSSTVVKGPLWNMRFLLPRMTVVTFAGLHLLRLLLSSSLESSSLPED